MNIFEWTEIEKNQSIDVWHINEQREVTVKRTIYTTETGDKYIKYKGALTKVCGSAEYGYHAKH